MINFLSNLFKNLNTINPKSKDLEDRISLLEDNMSSLRKENEALWTIIITQNKLLTIFQDQLGEVGLENLKRINTLTKEITEIYNSLIEFKTSIIQLNENQKVLDEGVKIIYNSLAESPSKEVH